MGGCQDAAAPGPAAVRDDVPAVGGAHDKESEPAWVRQQQAGGAGEGHREAPQVPVHGCWSQREEARLCHDSPHQAHMFSQHRQWVRHRGGGG